MKIKPRFCKWRRTRRRKITSFDKKKPNSSQPGEMNVLCPTLLLKRTKNQIDNSQTLTLNTI